MKAENSNSGCALVTDNLHHSLIIMSLVHKLDKFRWQCEHSAIICLELPTQILLFWVYFTGFFSGWIAIKYCIYWTIKCILQWLFAILCLKTEYEDIFIFVWKTLSFLPTGLLPDLEDRLTMKRIHRMLKTFRIDVPDFRINAFTNKTILFFSYFSFLYNPLEPSFSYLPFIVIVYFSFFFSQVKRTLQYKWM